MAKRFMSLRDFSRKLIDINYPDDEDNISAGSLLDGDFGEGTVYFVDDDGVKTLIEFIEQEGGGEGGSEYCETILKMGDKYLKVTYRYYSHHGYEYDYAEVYLVEPVQELVTFYR